MTSVRLNLVVAACNNNGIGKNGGLPWRLKKDMAFFKKITSETNKAGKQNAVIMGRKTWFSIPEKFRPLKGRVNIVLSRELKEITEGVHIARSLPEAVKLATSNEMETEIESVHIIGGSSVYKEAMTGPYDCRLYLTRIYKDFDCDTFLPAIDENTFQKIDNLEGVPTELQTENDISFRFEVYDKINTTPEKGVYSTNSVDTISFINQQPSLRNKTSQPSFTFNIMAAMCDGNRGIGMQQKLPWPSLRGDCEYFLTKTSTLQSPNGDNNRRKIIHINGRRTFESIGEEEMALPNVQYIVISKTFKESKFTHPKILKIVESFDEAIAECGQLWRDSELDSVWVMGGSSVYKVALEHSQCSRLYLTRIYTDFPADAFFPVFEDDFTEIREAGTSSTMQEENGIKYEFKVYKHKSSISSQ